MKKHLLILAVCIAQAPTGPRLEACCEGPPGGRCKIGPGYINVGPPAPTPMPLPKSHGAVAELLEDEATGLAVNLNNYPGYEPGNAAPDWNDRYSGVASLRVSVFQKYSHILPGWNFPITEKPNLGEYRYIRFAWKKKGGNVLMLQLCGDQYKTIKRYHAGQNATGWESMQLRQQVPDKWEVVTRDLYKDFGGFHLMGLAFSPIDGEYAMFDHIYLARTLEDLDRVAPITKPEKLTDERIASLWNDLIDDDAGVSVAARWKLASDPGCVEFLRKKLADRPAPVGEDMMAKLIRELDHNRFAVREAANRKLEDLGEVAVPLLERHLKEGASPEVSDRIGRILKKRASEGFAWTPERLRNLRAIRILEQMGTPAAREALGDQVSRPEAPLAIEAKAAVERIRK